MPRPARTGLKGSAGGSTNPIWNSASPNSSWKSIINYSCCCHRPCQKKKERQPRTGEPLTLTPLLHHSESRSLTDSMASTLSTRAVRTLSGPACRTLARPSAIESALLPRRALSTSTEAAPASQQDRPRWSYTPERAKAPFSLRIDSKRPAWNSNSDPKVLDRFYIGLLGPDGDKVLSDEVKWLAVTHKSFDQGRRGYNDRLAFLGTYKGKREEEGGRRASFPLLPMT